MGLISELRRRNVFRMAVLYLGVAWLVLQVVDLLIDRGPLPEALGLITLTVLVVGFPIAMILSWFYELSPEGISLDEDGQLGATSPTAGRRMDFVVIAVLAAAVLVFAYDKWWVPAPVEQSIVILPFTNTSAEERYDHFSEGIAVGVLDLLTQVPELRVISRQSAFSFKGKDFDLPSIAKQLNISYALEGSVNRIGNRLTVIAKLIDADSDTHVWSKAYEREMAGVFAIQTEIAATIIDQLKIETNTAPNAFETNTLAYEHYLLAQHFATSNDPEQAILELNRALDIDPEFAPAWTMLGSVARYQASTLATRDLHEGNELARQAILRSLEIDPDYGRSYAALAQVQMVYDWDFAAALENLQRALDLDPGDANVLFIASRLSLLLGNLDDAQRFVERLLDRSPDAHFGHLMLGSVYYYQGLAEEAKQSFRKAHAIMPTGFTKCIPGFVVLREGDPNTAIRIMENDGTFLCVQGLALAHFTLGDTERSDEYLNQLLEEWGNAGPYQIAEVYAYRGELEMAYEYLEIAYTQRDGGLVGMLSSPWLLNLRQDERWAPFVEKLGFPDSARLRY